MAEVTKDVDKDIEQFLDQASQASLLRFSTAGSVDDGKSTLIGRLLNDSKNIYEDHIEALQEQAVRDRSSFEGSLALLTDGLRAEREQGITIDVAYRYFSTPRRHFILADTPGHEQYTRNMATGASTSSLCVLLIDAQKGVITQTKRHAFIASLLGIPRILVTVNKMDLVDYSREVFERIKAEFEEFAAKLGVKELRFIPISALRGDNVVQSSTVMPWYKGETVMEYLETVYVAGDTNLVDFRFPVQCVLRPDQNYRGYAGQVSSGVIRVGEEVLVLPSMKKSRIKSINVYHRDADKRNLDVAYAPMSVALTLEDEIDIARGDMIVRSNNVPRVRNQFEAMLVWMHDQKMDPTKHYLLLHTSRMAKAFIEQIKYRVDVNTLSRLDAAPLGLNEIGRIAFSLSVPVLADSYNRNRNTGGFVLIDPASYLTVAAGMIIERLPQEYLPVGHSYEESSSKERVSQNIHREEGTITRKVREARFGNQATTLWFTGLSGSGKSSVAKALEFELFEQGRMVYRLDGDNLRFGLNRDLGFSKDDRTENIRRVAEVARLFNQAGITVLCSFISPFKVDRDNAREIIGTESFVEVHLDTPLEVCEERDPNGLYKKARAGEIREFTGISSPYEKPDAPEITLQTDSHSIAECVGQIMDYLDNN